MFAFVKRFLKGSNKDKKTANRVENSNSDMDMSNTKTAGNIRRIHSEEVTKTILKELSQLTKMVNEIKKKLPSVE